MFSSINRWKLISIFKTIFIHTIIMVSTVLSEITRGLVGHKGPSCTKTNSKESLM